MVKSISSEECSSCQVTCARDRTARSNWSLSRLSSATRPTRKARLEVLCQPDYVKLKSRLTLDRIRSRLIRAVVIPKIFQISVGTALQLYRSSFEERESQVLVKVVILPVMDLQYPSVLASLPRPLHASTGKTRIGEVYSLADAKKRKRYEVTVAVDGETVNIYNVRPWLTVFSRYILTGLFFRCKRPSL